MLIDEFTAKYNTKGIDYDGYYGFQCMDLYRQYVKECLEYPQSPSVTGACNVWDTYLKDYFDRISNTPDGMPNKGDIVIWNQGVGQYGHIAIFNSGNINDFVSFDQNWPVGSLCHYQPHNYNNVLGWLRPKNLPQQTQPINDQTKIWLGDELGTMEVQAIRSNLLDQRHQIASLQEQVNNMQTQVTKLTSDINSLKQNIVLLEQIRDIIWGRGWVWTRMAQIKELLPK